MDRPPPPEFWARIVKDATVAWLVVSCIVLVVLVTGLAAPRFAPLIAVGLIGGAVLLFIYRDQFVQRK
ncbi:MAG: hypothetical protein M3406_09795 [Chloroflexota bacterium]|nr:hypothetical protein [Chloroflexota bacterium]